jgi:hypothetical protein
LEAQKELRARYGIEIRGTTLRADADNLAQISALLNGHTGLVHVVDRQNQSLLLGGSVDEVRKVLDSQIAPCGGGEITKLGET